MNRQQAHSFLATLRVNDPVVLTKDGRRHEMHVGRELRRGDGGGFGSWDYAVVTVTFGPGRWATEVHAVGLEKGLYQLEPAT